ncbi:MAG: hypothetical protein ACKVH4_00595, partial [Flavobacteriales bacterium]
FRASYTNAKPVTINAAIPLRPDFEIPSKKAQKAASAKLKRESEPKRHHFLMNFEDTTYFI